MWREASVRDAWVRVPSSTRVEFGSLVYDPAQCQLKKTDGTKLLLKFVELSSPEGVRDFAARNGVLYLDDWGLPVDERRLRLSILGVIQYGPAGREPIERWLYYARAFRSVLSIAAKLHSGLCGTAEEWELVYGKPVGARGSRYLDTEKLFLATVLWEWSLISSLRPVVRWEAEPTIDLSSRSLFDVLLLALMLRVCRSDGLAICGSCQMCFSPSVRARRGEIRFCDQCRDDGSAARISAKLYRARKKG
jgi:hypothetical protein